MSIETTKLELMHLLLQTQQKSTLTKLKKVFEEEQTNWFNEMSLEEQQELRKGIIQADNQDVIPHNEVMNNFKKWH